MDSQLIKSKFLEWVENFVEKSHPLLFNWPPCPYARAARLNNKVAFTISSVHSLKEHIYSNLHLLNTNEVIVVCIDHTTILPNDLEAFVKLLNEELMPQDYVILEDHPNNEETINSVKMNFGVCALLLIQKLSKLNKAATQLKNQGYYDCWSTDNLKDVVTWRD